MPPCDLARNFVFDSETCVSILVLVDAALRQAQIHDHGIDDTVSILVLVDAALRPHPILVDIVFAAFSFNPCFSGCRPATRQKYPKMVIEDGFNPCFSGCRPATCHCTSSE